MPQKYKMKTSKIIDSQRVNIKRKTSVISGRKPARILSDRDYEAVMTTIDKLMAKGSDKVSDDELFEIRKLALMAAEYEKEIYHIAVPSTLAGIIEMKMFEMHLNQKEMAKKLKVSSAKLSLILNGKQKPDVPFIKTAYEDLHVNADMLLKAI